MSFKIINFGRSICSPRDRKELSEKEKIGFNSLIVLTKISDFRFTSKFNYLNYPQRFGYEK
jgi:hypothetical protein